MNKISILKSKYRIDLASLQDAEEIHHLITETIRVACAGDYGFDAHVLNLWCSRRSLESIREWVADPLSEFIIVRSQSTKHCDAVGLLQKPNKIKLCYVHPRVAQNGLGSWIMDSLEQKARDWKLTSFISLG